MTIASGLIIAAALTRPVYASGAAVTDESMIADGISIGGIDVSGMKVSEAQRLISDEVDKAKAAEITVYCVNNESTVLLPSDIGLKWNNPDVVRQAAGYANRGNIVRRYKDRKDIEREGISLPIEYGISDDKLRTFIEESCSVYDVEAVDATLSREEGEFVIVPGVQGAMVDEESSVRYLRDFLTKEWNGRSCEVELPIITDEPKGTEEELSQVTDLLGSFSTGFKNSDENRAINVINGCNLVDGHTLYPGDEFSVYESIRPFSVDNGYRMAGSYLNGLVVDSLGGGICQVSTTLYNAVIRAELEVTERHNHGMTVSYVPISQDAAIAESSGMDMRFRNNLEYPVYIEGYVTDDREIVFNIYGREYRDESRMVEFETNIIETIVPEGERVVAVADKPVGFYSTQGVHTGYKAQLIKIVKENGSEVSREVFNQSTYKAVPRTAALGTKSDDPNAVAVINEAIATQSVDAAVTVAAAYAAQAAMLQAAQAIGAP